MKFIVALTGALLSLAGGYALFQGLSIIQVERGWATFIAGAVLLGAGVIVIAIAALMGRVDRLADLYEETLALAEQDETDDAPARPAAVALTEPEPPRRPAPVAISPAPAEPAPQTYVAPEPLAPEPPPPPPRDFRVAQPAFVAPVTFPEPPPALPPEPEAAPQPVTEPRPAALRDFQFVFPADSLSAQTAPAREPEPEPEQIAEAAPVEAETPANVGWLRRAREARAERERQAETAQIWAPPPGFDHTETPAENASLAGENFDDQAAEAASADREPESAPPAQPEPVAEAEPAPPAPEPEPEPDPFGNEWLERALAEANEAGQEAAAPPAPARRPPPLELVAAEPQGAPTNLAGSDLEDEVVLQAPPAPMRNGAAAPVEIGRYRANNVAYIMFSDGSITAETPAGKNYRFSSLKELRAFIERGDM